MRQDRLDIDGGADFTASWPLYDADGLPLDVSAPGWSARAQVRAYQSADVVLAEWVSTGSAPQFVLANSTLTLTIPGAMSAAWSWLTGVYDVLLTSPAGKSARVAEGPVYVSPPITR